MSFIGTLEAIYASLEFEKIYGPKQVGTRCQRCRRVGTSSLGVMYCDRSCAPATATRKSLVIRPPRIDCCLEVNYFESTQVLN